MYIPPYVCNHPYTGHDKCQKCGAIQKSVSEPVTLRYETDSMAHLRQLLFKEFGRTDEDIDTFKGCLINLEKLGYVLIKQEKIS